jgi:hypothetical protein
MLNNNQRSGLIKEGQYKNWLITLLDDTEGSTGGYYLILKNGTETFDYWFERREYLENQLVDFEVHWDQVCKTGAA